MSGSELSCREAIRLLAAYLDGELNPDEHGQVERHLHRCRECYSRAEFERRLNRQLAELGRRPVDPPFERRIRGMIRQFGDAPPSDGPPDPA